MWLHLGFAQDSFQLVQRLRCIFAQWRHDIFPEAYDARAVATIGRQYVAYDVSLVLGLDKLGRYIDAIL